MDLKIYNLYTRACLVKMNLNKKKDQSNQIGLFFVNKKFF